jgi:hypothetical protein
MATSRKRKIQVATTNVQLHRNGLVLDMQGVPPDQLESVAAHMLDAVRSLVKRGYKELIEQGGTFHAAPLGEATDDSHADEGKRIGFRP